MRIRMVSLAVVMLALAAVTIACGGDDSTASGTTTTSTIAPTTTSTTSTPECALDGATDASQHGDAALEAGAHAALLRNVEVEASVCVDAVVLLFWHGTPGYTLEYRDGPFTADPSGQPVAVPGRAFLAVHLDPASGVDLTSPDATRTYTGPPVLTPAPPSGIAELHQLGDFESVNTWVIGLDVRRPFTVERKATTLVIDIAAPAARTAQCTTGGVEVTLPDGWFADVAGEAPCQLFDPAPFAVQPQTDDVSWAVRVDASTTTFDDAVARWRGGNTATVVGSSPRTIDGHRATAIELESNGAGMAPAGWRTFACIVDRDAAGSVSIVVASTEPGATYDLRRAGAEKIAASLQL